MPLLNCINDYLKTCGAELGRRVIEQFPPLHQPSDPVWPEIPLLKRHPFPAQTLAIMGIVKRWEQARCAAAVAECGTGKTLISLGSIFTHARGKTFTALTMVPPQLVEKWARECFLTAEREVPLLNCINDYLKTCGAELGRRVIEQFPPLHQPSDPVWPEIPLLKRHPFPVSPPVQ